MKVNNITNPCLSNERTCTA